MLFSDSEIINSLQNNEELGIKRLFDKYYCPLALFAEEYLGDPMLAEDIVQNTFVRFWDKKSLSRVSPAAQIQINSRYYPTEVNIQFLDDKTKWREGFYQIQSRIGNGNSESTILYLPEATTARYVKVTIMDKISTYDRNTCQGDILIF